MSNTGIFTTIPCLPKDMQEYLKTPTIRALITESLTRLHLHGWLGPFYPHLPLDGDVNKS